MGMVPTISVEKTDGCQMYLSKEAAEKTEIITAKSSEMNVLAPNPEVSYFLLQFQILLLRNKIDLALRLIAALVLSIALLLLGS